MVTKTYTIDKVLMKLFQKFPGLDGVQGLKLAHMGTRPSINITDYITAMLIEKKLMKDGLVLVNFEIYSEII